MSATIRERDAAPGRILKDAFDRHLYYLRLSLTDRCNYRCLYCLPEGCPRVPTSPPLSLDEVGRLAGAFAALGFWKVRLTGGEPTLRADLGQVIRRIAGTPGVERVALTTNGHRLAALAGELREAGLTSLNVSLDSLDPERFRQITGRGELEAVVAGIERALEVGIPSIKVNVVLQRGLCDSEIARFLAWTEEHPLTVRFIELMETEQNRSFFKEAHLPAEEIRQKLEREGWMVEGGGHEGPSTNYRHPGHEGRAGIISAYESGFCRSCNRLRVSAAGDLRLCLFGDEEVPLRPLLQKDDQRGDLIELVESAVKRKPASHLLEEGRCGSMRSFSAVGG